MKVNPSTKGALIDKDNRLAGGIGKPSAKQDELSLLKRCVFANLLWENLAYENGVEVSSEISRLIPLCRPEDVYQVALDARLIQKLRHTPLFIAAEMCKYEGHRKYLGKLLPQIITRVDMISDFLALYWKDGKKKPIPNQVKKGLAQSFHNFDEYQFAKYDRENQVKIRDVMFMCHPTPKTKEQEELFKKIADRTLEKPNTWEVRLSSGEDKKAVWTDLINTRKIGGLAMLRNINNMMKANVNKLVIEEGINKLSSSMLLPLDFIKASKMAPEFNRQLEVAMVNSYSRLPRIPGKSLIVIDVSGSMDSYLSEKSSFARIIAASALAILAINQCEDVEIVCTGGTAYHPKHFHIKYPAKGFDLIEQIKKSREFTGYGGIYTRDCLNWCRKEFNEEEFDRIIVFSDSQDCDSSGKLPQPFGKSNYICDVSSHTRGINYKGVWTAEISGFSEHFLTYIAAIEGVENSFEENDI